MNYKYSGVVCSDLDMIKNFIDEVLVKIDGLVKNSDLMFDIKLILNELVINGVFHGNRCISSRCVKLSLDLEKDKITIEVEDEGAGIEFDFENYDPTNLTCGGRGLVLVNGLSDEFYIQKNKVTAIKHIDYN